MTLTADPTPAASHPPRPEYPRPQLRRDIWLNLNGTWGFETDPGDSGLERGLVTSSLAGQITVPFAPESELSGIENTDFLHVVWYRRTVSIPADWADQRILLHFGAVDHDATVWVDGKEVGRHRGGFASFTVDLTGAAEPGTDAVITVRARDLPHLIQARGKQSINFANKDCHYTRTTGIWQTVWLEPVPPAHVRRLKITPNVATSSFTVVAELGGTPTGQTLRVVLRDADGEVATAEYPLGLDLAPQLTLTVPDERRRLWSPADPHLYDLSTQILDSIGAPLDTVDSYAGLRSVTIIGNQILINGQPVFQRLVLDQGYWPESLMTAPSDQHLIDDITLSMAAGFNGARLHQKVFEERFYYHADRLGYLVWGEFGDWGCNLGGPDGDNQQPTTAYVTQWLEVVQRDHNHPSIIGWCPLNETWQLLSDRMTQLDDVTRAMFLATKLSDPSRPVLDTSGYSHRVPEADVYDSHNYEQDPAKFAEAVGGLAAGSPYTNTHHGPLSLPYAGQPYFVSEYGGIWWNAELAASNSGKDRETSWGYGDRVRTEEEFYSRFADLTDALLDDPDMFGYCYTQLTDTFQEQNGIYNFDRSTKVDVDRIREIQQRTAAYEQRVPGDQ